MVLSSVLDRYLPYLKSGVSILEVPDNHKTYRYQVDLHNHEKWQSRDYLQDLPEHVTSLL